MGNAINTKEQVDQTVGFAAGAWDLFHAGHVLFLREARKLCGKLVVGLHVNPASERKSKNKPVQTVYERYLQLNACQYVDSILPYETEAELIQILRTQRINFRFLGSDYAGVNPEIITGYNITPIVFIDRNHSYSSSDLRLRVISAQSSPYYKEVNT